jgi:hypothetical protein
MEMFNVKRRDLLDFDQYMDLKKPGFGGSKSAIEFKDKSGKRVVKDPKLKDYQRVVERDPMFSHSHYNSTYKAMTHDVIYKQEKKKPVTYTDPYLTALPVVDVSAQLEGRSYESFNHFLAEEYNEEVEMEKDFEVPDEIKEIEMKLRQYE